MAIGRWKDLCFDAGDVGRIAGFWALVLGLEPERRDNGAALRGVRPEQTVWINEAPEPKAVKNRVHLDLVFPDIAPLLDAGARAVHEVRYDDAHWTVLADPEGGEFCVFDEPPNADVVGGEPVAAPGGDPRWIANVPGQPFEVVKFVDIDERKVVKTRNHWDIVSDDVDALVSWGAGILRRPDDQVRWHVLPDPAGNEFCLFAP
jgi:hypothetical protein